MKVYCIAFILVITCLRATSFACTTFFIEKKGEMMFGKNYDWVTGTGAIHTNLSGLVKQALPVDGSAPWQWTAQYGSITFNQYGKEFPNGGMNEAGLVVELMWLNESEYPAKDNRQSLSVLQWIQYQLDNCSTVDQVISTDENIRISSTGTPQHYLIADKKGNVAAIEFLHGQMVVHRNKDLPYAVLTNSTYSQSVYALNNNRIQNNSLERFATTCKRINNYQSANPSGSLLHYSFEILEQATQPAYTKWSIVYDIKRQSIHFSTAEDKKAKHIKVKDFNFSCSAPALMFNLQKPVSGEINQHFTPYNNATNTTLVKKAFYESTNIQVPGVLQNAVANIASSSVCK